MNNSEVCVVIGSGLSSVQWVSKLLSECKRVVWICPEESPLTSTLGKDVSEKLFSRFDSDVPVHFVVEATKEQKLLDQKAESVKERYSYFKIIKNVPINQVKIEGSSGVAQKVVLNNEEVFDAYVNMVLVEPTDTANNKPTNKTICKLAKLTELKIDERNGGIKVNPFMQTSDPHIFAAGEIVSAPDWISGSIHRSQSVQAAQG